MPSQSARVALRSALLDSHHLAALAVVAVAFGVAAAVGSSVAYYAAALVAFSVWMGWFVLTTVEWLRRGEL